MADFIPSTHQTDIFRWISDGRGKTLVVEALAGTGKTSTAVEAVFQADWGRRIALFAFSKEIQKELTKRFEARLDRDLEKGDPYIKTMHGLGFGAIMWATRRIGRVELVNSKYRAEVKRWRAQYDKTGRGFAGFELTSAEQLALGAEWSSWASSLLGLFNVARLELVDFTAKTDRVFSLARKHQIDIEPGLHSLTARALRSLAAYGRDTKLVIDFTDMLWIPCVEGYRPRQFDLIFIDECQDLSRAQLELALRARARNGRMVFIGDRCQAIFGFAGADADSFDNIVNRTEAEILPLSICYRCPDKVLDLARELCPQIETRPDAPDGEVISIMHDELAGWVEDGDMVLCRLTAPLVTACFKLLADGIPAIVRGRDIADGLVTIIKKIADKSDFSAFGDALTSWCDGLIAYSRRHYADEDQQQQAIDQAVDQSECLRIIWARASQRGDGSFESMLALLHGLFSDDRESVILSTVHRAKGLEADRVFILKPDLLRRPRARGRWRLEQEKNLYYVALTRAKSSLFFVEEPVKLSPKAKPKLLHSNRVRGITT